jgi:CRISPR-associated protein Csy3
VSAGGVAARAGRKPSVTLAAIGDSAPLGLPSVLSFRRAFEISDAVMTAARSADPVDAPRLAVAVYDHGKRTTASYESRSAKRANEPGRRADESRNLVFGEEAKLPSDCDTLCVDLSMRVLPLQVEPDSCDDTVWYERLRHALGCALESSAIDTLARYYAFNLANGSWLWRNRDVSDAVRIEISFSDRVVNQTLVIEDARMLALTPVLPAGASGEDPHLGCREIDALAHAIRDALRGTIRGLRIRVTARALMMPGQSVWPSQRYTPTRQRIAGRIDMGRLFFRACGGAGEGAEDPPGMTAEKIGNALRTFDRDHGDARFPGAVIPAEPNGGVLRLGVNLRGSGNRFYDHLKSLINGAPWGGAEPLTEAQLRYVLAIFVRGGVFGSSDRETASTEGLAA